MGKRKHQALGRLLQFTVDDLRTNSEGVLSPQQRRTLQWRRFWHGDVGIGVTWACMCAVGFVGLWLEFTEETRPVLDFLLWVWILFFTAFLVFVGAWFAFSHIRRVHQDIRAGIVERVSGVLQYAHRTLPKGGGTIHYLLVGGQMFEVSYKVQHQFTPDKHYHLYVAPHSRLVLSAEVIPEHEIAVS